MFLSLIPWSGSARKRLPHPLYDLSTGTVVCCSVLQYLICSTMNHPQPHRLCLSLSWFFFLFPAWDPSRMQCPDEVWWVVSRGHHFHKFILKPGFCQYLWQWFFEQPNLSFVTLECTNLFYLKACFTPFTPFYFSLNCFIIKALNKKFPAFMYNSPSSTGSIFSHHSFPSVDVSSIHYYQST